MLNGAVRPVWFAAVAVVAVCGWGCAHQSNVAPQPHSTVVYGRITAVNAVTVNDTNAQVAGALVGGSIGLISGSGQSGSNQALRGVGGAFAGQQIGRLASRRQAFEYTILLGGTSTITMVSDEAGLRVGDCVSVERGTFNNLRLTDDAQCASGVTPTANDVQEADACVAAKQELLKAETDAAFDHAERQVRLLCADQPEERI